MQLMTLFAVVPLGDLGIIVEIYFSDTDVLVMALCTVPELSAESVILMSTGAKLPLCQTQAYLRYSGSLQDKQLHQGCMHLLVHTSLDTGHRPQGKRTPTYFKTFLKAPDDVISALGDLEVGAYPLDQVLCGYEQLLVSTLLLWR